MEIYFKTPPRIIPDGFVLDFCRDKGYVLVPSRLGGPTALKYRRIYTEFTKRYLSFNYTNSIYLPELIEYCKENLPFISRTILYKAVSELVSESVLVVKKDIGDETSLATGKEISGDLFLWDDKDLVARYKREFDYVYRLAIGRIHDVKGFGIDEEFLDIFEIRKAGSIIYVPHLFLVMQLVWLSEYLKSNSKKEFIEYLEDYIDSALSYYFRKLVYVESFNNVELVNVIDQILTFPIAFESNTVIHLRQVLKEIRERWLLKVSRDIDQLINSSGDKFLFWRTNYGKILDDYAIVHFLEEEKNILVDWVSNGSFLVVNPNAPPDFIDKISVAIQNWLSDIADGTIGSGVSFVKHSGIHISRDIVNKIMEMSDTLVKRYNLIRDGKKFFITGVSRGYPDLVLDSFGYNFFKF